HPVQVDSFDSAHVSIGHQAEGLARGVLAAIAAIPELVVELGRAKGRQLADELDEVLEARFSQLARGLHPGARERYHGPMRWAWTALLAAGASVAAAEPVAE